MADFAGFEDWSLQAIVGGSAYNTTPMADSYGMWDMMPQVNGDDHDDDFLFALSENFGQTSKLVDDDDDEDGLEALGKPFYPPVSDSISTQTTSHFSSTISAPTDEAEEVDQQKAEPTAPDQSTCNVIVTPYEPKYKRRKNQHKREVILVKAEDLSSDRWAWRKYGQKPIKGSPYPRSYYRCSSKKGCLARKQVEQSCTDPSMYVVIYTAEHCHSQPTRRNSLAGTVRNKSPATTYSDIHKANMAKTKDSITSSPASNEGISPKSPGTIMVQQENLDGDHEEQTVDQLAYIKDEEFSISDIMINGDFFAGLEDLNNGYFLESALGSGTNYAAGSFQNMQTICGKY